MPRGNRLRDYLMRRDGRNPYGSEGGYVTSSRRDRGMDYAYDRRNYRSGNYEYNSRRGDRAYNEQDMERGRRDYESMGQSDMARSDYGDMRGRGRVGHYPMVQGYMPVEAMGRFTGYYGMGEDDYARGRNYDYGYDYAGDYGEKLTKEELEHWRKKLDKEVGDEQSKHFFKKENIEQKAKQMGVEMKQFDAEELALASYMIYSDYCKSLKPYVGSNMDIYVKMGAEFLNDPDSAVKGGEKLALYHELVSGEDD